MSGVPKVRINPFLQGKSFWRNGLKKIKAFLSDIKIIPFDSRTLVVSHTHEEVFYRIYNEIKPQEHDLFELKGKENYAFNGSVSMSHFRITKKIQLANSFIPVLHGKIEPTNSGCLLFLKYKMMPFTVFLLVFTSLLLISFGTYCAFISQEYIYALLALGGFIFVYAVAVLNFYRLQKITHSTFSNLMQ